jgi:hypothetical protein
MLFACCFTGVWLNVKKPKALTMQKLPSVIFLAYIFLAYLLPNNHSWYAKRLFLIFESGIIKRFIGSRNWRLPMSLCSLTCLSGRDAREQNIRTLYQKPHQNLRNV